MSYLSFRCTEVQSDDMPRAPPPPASAPHPGLFSSLTTLRLRMTEQDSLVCNRRPVIFHSINGGNPPYLIDHTAYQPSPVVRVAAYNSSEDADLV
jgi:hypothetical protein